MRFPLARRRPLYAYALLLLLLAPLLGCAPRVRAGSLPPTLALESYSGESIAVQNGIPVPSFEWQSRSRLDLGGDWLIERQQFDADLSLTERGTALPLLEDEAAGRTDLTFADDDWEAASVPGTLNRPPAEPEIGAWYRRHFTAPHEWSGQSVTLKFGSVNYIADVWLNGVWLGYHEGGYTPFAFEVGSQLLLDEGNVLTVRVDNPAWGSRNDIVPWGLADWWNYGGITGEVWLEAAPPLYLVRADVVPHLDAVDVAFTVYHSPAVVPATVDAFVAPPPDSEPNLALVRRIPRTLDRGARDARASSPARSLRSELILRIEVLPARVTAHNLASPDVRALVPIGAEPLAISHVRLDPLGVGQASRVPVNFVFGGADLWSPDSPSLYVLRATLTDLAGNRDELWTSFGLRRLSVVADSSQLLLNGESLYLRGVGLHDEQLTATEGGGWEADRIFTAGPLRDKLTRARGLGVNLLRTAHTPANPLLLMLADRMGFAVWEEIPLYHFTPLTFEVSMDRGIPQQMLREMALRDMNRPSVLFHGLANESTGGVERTQALATLHDIDRAIDGTRLTGQAAYGSMPDDPTQQVLDVAGFTFYYDVFYGGNATHDTAAALAAAHETNPDKPLIVLEFGRWSDSATEEVLQQNIFEQTYTALERHSNLHFDGFLAGATWWRLDDYATAVPITDIEHFGLFAPDGQQRPVASAVRDAFNGNGEPALAAAESGARVVRATDADAGDDWLLALYLAYGLLSAIALLGLLLAALLLRGGRSGMNRLDGRRP